MIDTPRQSAAWQDPIVAEVRAARQALFAAAGCDIREFCRRLRRGTGSFGASSCHPGVR
jgi:hypothetical protein